MNLPSREKIAVPTPAGMTRAEHREQADLLLCLGLRSLQAINDKSTSGRGIPVVDAQVQLAGTQALILAAQVHATLARLDDRD